MMSCHPERSAQRGVEGSRAASASALFDLHCHLDFDPDVRVAAQELAELDMGAFSTTVTPEGYEWACELLEPWAIHHGCRPSPTRTLPNGSSSSHAHS